MILRHSGTGQVITFDADPGKRSLYRFGLACKGFDRVCTREHYEAWFLTLTLKTEWAEKGVANEQLNRFFNNLRNRLRAAGSGCAYVWVTELQERRYTTTGVAALHWHMVVGAALGALPNVVYDGRYRVITEGRIVQNQWLIKRWGLGNILCTKVRGGTDAVVKGYLGAYLAKSEHDWREMDPEKWRGLRRFGCSRSGKWGWPLWALVAGLELEESCGYAIDATKRGSHIQLVADTGVVVADRRTPWRLEHV